MQGCSRSFLLRTRVDLTDVTFHSCKFPSPQQKTNKNCPEILQRNTKLSMSQPAPRTSFCCGRIFANWALTKGRFALTSSDFHGFFSLGSRWWNTLLMQMQLLQVNMQAREYCGSVGIKHKPIILSHHMLFLDCIRLHHVDDHGRTSLNIFEHSADIWWYL